MMEELAGTIERVGFLTGKFIDNPKLIGSISNRSEHIFAGSINQELAFSGKLIKSEGYDTYNGKYVVTPRASESQTLNTANKLLKQNVTVLEIPFYETSNNANGTTVYIAKEV